MPLAVINQTDQIYKQMDAIKREHHKHLEGARIIMFMDYSEPSGSALTFGTASLASSQVKALSGANFVITINALAWDNLDEEGRTALLDHELSHCHVCLKPMKDGRETIRDAFGRVQYTNQVKRDADGNIQYRIIPHDVTEFISIVKRRGLWMENLQKMRATMQQLDMIDSQDEAYAAPALALSG